MSLGDKVTRYAHGSRVPGWDESVDPAKDPAPVPDPATVESRRTCGRRSRATWPSTPTAARRRSPRSRPPSACTAGARRWRSRRSPRSCGSRPGYIVAVATFYDQLDTRPVGRHRVYVCTNISCSLRGGDELLDAIEHEMAEDPDVYVRHFECLGACDIAPMASIDGIYVGPIELEEVPVLAEQIRNGEAPLPDKQILRRASTDPTANTREFPRPNPLAQRAVPDASIPVRPPEQGTYGEQMPGDQPGPSAPLEDR